MRDGHYITEGNFTDFTMDEIIANMVGREIKEKFPHVECEERQESIRGQEPERRTPGKRYQFLAV